MLPHATRKDPRLQHSNEQLGHAIAIMPARIEKNKNFMNVTNRALQCCAVAKNYGRKNAKLAWTTPFVSGIVSRCNWRIRFLTPLFSLEPTHSGLPPENSRSG
jgi:hypothetical protein